MKQRLVILHSFGRTSQDNWYQAVGQTLVDAFIIATPDLPNPDDGKMAEWLPALITLNPDSNTYLVGHSLGGTLILRYLEQTQEPIAGFFLVGAPVNDLARNDLHETGFFERDFEWDKIKQNSNKRFTLASIDDPTVPFWQAEYIAKQVDAKLITFYDKGHFKQPDFPELVELLKKETTS